MEQKNQMQAKTGYRKTQTETRRNFQVQISNLLKTNLVAVVS